MNSTHQYITSNPGKPVIPYQLQPGDTIGIAAPAGSFYRDRLNYGIRYLEEKGFTVLLPPDIYYRQRTFAGSDIHRALHLEKLFQDHTVKAVLCVRGGYGCLKLLPHLNLEIIRANPKIFMGFSDITVLLNIFVRDCRLVTFHGPMLNTFANISRHSLEAGISSLTSAELIKLSSNNPLIIKHGVAQGEVIGGNLATLCHLLGTHYQPVFNKKILFLEDVNEAGYRIDRMLTQMKYAGCFESLVGLVLGVFQDCCTETELSHIIQSVFSDYGFPIMSGLPVGHGTVNLTIPLGLNAVLDTHKKSLNFQLPAVQEKA